MKISMVLLVFSFLACPANAICASTPEIEYLINEPASMWDLAFVRMQLRFDREVRHVAETIPGLAEISVVPSYSQERNEILVVVLARCDGFTTDFAVREIIRKFHQKYYEEYPMLLGRGYGRGLFGHWQFSSKAEDSVDLDKLVALIKFRWSVMFLGGEESQPEFGKVVAEWNLDGSDFMLSE